MIKFLDLKAVNDSYEPELSQAIKRVLDSGWYLLGKEVKGFEAEYGQFIGTKHCIAVANGLDALRLILKAYLEMGHMHEGDEIIVQANTYIASILAITDNRLKPVFVEPDVNTCNIDPDKIEEKITDRTKGIMIVHLYGQNAMHPEIGRLVEKYGLKLIEDNAQAAGCFYCPLNSVGPLSHRTGSLSHAAGHSFYPGKNIGALGDAGAVTTNDDELAAVVRSIANYGSTTKYVSDYQGLNSRMDEIQAAILRVKLKRLDADNQRRREVAQYYNDTIQNESIILPKPAGGSTIIGGSTNTAGSTIISDLSHIWHIYAIRHPKRDALQQYLAEHDIQTSIHYPIPPHKQQAYKNFNQLSFPVTEQMSRELLSLPMSQVMTQAETEIVVKTINRF